MPRAVLTVVMALSAVAPARAAPIDAGIDAQVVIQGKGYGHGVGMAQDGAYAMALAGASVTDILSTFYPGTSIGGRSGVVRVDLLDKPAGAVVIAFPSGGQLRTLSGQPPGFPITVSPGGSVEVSLEGGRYHASPLGGAAPATVASPAPPAASANDVAAPSAPPATTSTTVPSLLGLIPLPPLTEPPTSSPTTVPSPSPSPPPPPLPDVPSLLTSEQPLAAVPEGSSLGVPSLGRQYRGTLEARAAGGGLQLVNELDVEQYLRGMGEVLEPGWPPAALQAQAIAARTYALDAMAGGRSLCSNQQCQVYVGETVEYAAMNRAVADTSGQVVVYDGRLAEAVYSANGGGISATPEEGFGPGSPEYAYLRAVPYPTRDPQPWEVQLSLAELAARVGYPGEASAVQVSRAGPSGRALEITLTGDAGPQAVEGQRFADQLQLRSTLFTLDVERQDVASADGPPRVRGALHRPAYVLQAGGREVELGRARWEALAVLLLAGWATAARAYTASPRYQR